MIPKIIHYCWFGGNSLPDLALKCIDSWKKYCPDYEIICWDETNYTFDKKSIYVQEAYEEKKWAFVSDYARLDIIYNYGGIYLDTDVELIASLDDLLDEECFLGLETSGFIATGLGFGAEKNNIAIKKMLDEYKDIHFRIDKGIFDTIPCPRRNTVPFWSEGLNEKSLKIQYLQSATIYPPEYFCPLDYVTNCINITSNTRSIHHYGSMWISESDKQIRKMVEGYKKNHGWMTTLLYKNILEFRFKKIEDNTSFYKFIAKKLKRKWLKIQGKLN